MVSLPFTTEDFLSVFAAYNNAIWPTQLILVALGSISVFFAAVPSRRTRVFPVALLALLWAWSGVVYHLLFFRAINPIAWIFGAMFVVQAGLLIHAFRHHNLEIVAKTTPSGILGWLIVVYGITGYQISTEVAGHYYPSAPTFGAPCPLVIFTLGMLLWNVRKTPWYLLVIPMTWSAIATIGAFATGVFEDLALTLAAIVVLLVELQPRLHFHHPAASKGSP
jgi:hypothetical protein